MKWGKWVGGQTDDTGHHAFPTHSTPMIIFSLTNMSILLFIVVGLPKTQNFYKRALAIVHFDGRTHVLLIQDRQNYY